MELDFQNGTRTVIKTERKRYYHMRMRCIDARHGKIDVSKPGLIQVSYDLLPSLDQVENELIARFERGGLY